VRGADALRASIGFQHDECLTETSIVVDLEAAAVGASNSVLPIAKNSSIGAYPD
jgi:hypothetical protein